MNVPMFVKLQKRSKHSQEEMLLLDCQTHLNGLLTKILACDISLFFFLTLFVIHCTHLNQTLLQNLNLAANQNNTFFGKYCSHGDHFSDALYNLNLDILFTLYHLRQMILLCCIFQLNHL